MANKTAPYQLTFAICRRTCQRKRNYVLCFIHTLVYQLQTSRAEGLKSFLIIYKEQAARLCFVSASVVLLFRTLYGTPSISLCWGQNIWQNFGSSVDLLNCLATVAGWQARTSSCQEGAAGEECALATPVRQKHLEHGPLVPLWELIHAKPANLFTACLFLVPPFFSHRMNIVAKTPTKVQHESCRTS